MQYKKGEHKKIILIAGLILNIGVLFLFKYFDFFSQNIHLVTGINLPLVNLIMPLGISFYTFQQISYLIDSYRNELDNYNILDYFQYVTFFPCIIQGPISYHDEMIPQFRDNLKKQFNPDNFAKGIWLFTIGLSKKVLIADTFGLLVNQGFTEIEALGSINAILVMLAYTFQIYFDFSGYCTMAEGLAQMLNFEIPNNFKYPYKALTIVDFWKRWHRTLTRFFTKYIYIPLGGNRKGELRTYLNILIVFLISGLWHGAAWTFVVWGLLHGIAQIFTKYVDNKRRVFSYVEARTKKFIMWLLTFLFINLTWVMFRSVDIHQAMEFYKQLLDVSNLVIDRELLEVMRIDTFELICNFIPVVGEYIMKYIYVILSIISFIIIRCEEHWDEKLGIEIEYGTKKAIFTVVLLFLSIISLSGVSSFLYWEF